MKQDLYELIRNAHSSTKSRGHVLNVRWILHPRPQRMIAYNGCIYCKKEVQVNTNPLPNQIDIGGEAVALECND